MSYGTRGLVKGLSRCKKSEMDDDPPIRGTRLLSDIYQRCNVVVYELVDHKEVINEPKWKKAMEEELYMVEKNKTWEFVNIP